MTTNSGTNVQCNLASHHGVLSRSDVEPITASECWWCHMATRSMWRTAVHQICFKKRLEIFRDETLADKSGYGVSLGNKRVDIYSWRSVLRVHPTDSYWPIICCGDYPIQSQAPVAVLRPWVCGGTPWQTKFILGRHQKLPIVGYSKKVGVRGCHPRQTLWKT